MAGGTGSRLHPITKITNKHLLPVYNKPMVFYPIETLVDAGIDDILLVTGGKNSGDFLRLLANGKQFGAHLSYTYQEGEGGIADALSLAQRFAQGESVCVILGDNIIEGSIRECVEAFRRQERGARILLKQVADAERFGVAEIVDGRISGIEEKPEQPKSNYAVTGIYMYDSSVFSKIHELVPSRRGELEITDVNNAYIREGAMQFSFLDGWWTDAGTFESLLRAANLVAQKVDGVSSPSAAPVGAASDPPTNLTVTGGAGFIGSAFARMRLSRQFRAGRAGRYVRPPGARRPSITTSVREWFSGSCRSLGRPGSAEPPAPSDDL